MSHDLDPMPSRLYMQLRGVGSLALVGCFGFGVTAQIFRRLPVEGFSPPTGVTRCLPQVCHRPHGNGADRTDRDRRADPTDDEAKAGIRARLATCGEIQP